MKGWYKEGHRHSLAARGIKTSFAKKIDIYLRPFEAPRAGRGRIEGEESDYPILEKFEAQKETFGILGKGEQVSKRGFSGDFSDVSQCGELSEASKRLLEGEKETPLEITTADEPFSVGEAPLRRIGREAGEKIENVFFSEPEEEFVSDEEKAGIRRELRVPTERRPDIWHPRRSSAGKLSFQGFIRETGMEHIDKSPDFFREFKVSSSDRILSFLEELGINIYVPSEDVNYYVKQLESGNNIRNPFVVMRGNEVVESGNIAQLKAAEIVGIPAQIEIVRDISEAEERAVSKAQRQEKIAFEEFRD